MENDSFSPLTAGVLVGEIDNDLRLIRQGSREKQSEDVILHDFLLLGHRAALLYIDGLSDDEKLQRFVLAPCLNAPPVPAGREPGEYLSRSVLQVASVQRTSRLSEVLCCVCGGDAALISESLNVGTKIGPWLCLLYVDGVAKKENVAEMKRGIRGWCRGAFPCSYVSRG